MLEVIARLDPIVDLFDVNVGGWPEDSGTSRYFPEGHQLPWHVARPRGHRQADRRSRPVHQPRRDGRADPRRGVRPDRSRSAGDRRSVPADQDPRGPARRDPRMHRLQRLHPARRGISQCRLHPEPDRGRGVPPRLASGDASSPSTIPSDPVLVVGGGPAGMECAMVLGRRGYRRRTPGRGRGPSSAASCAGPGSCRPSATGAGSSTIARSACRSCRTSRSSLGRRMTAADILEYGAEIVVIATGSSWVGDGTQPIEHPCITGADAALTPEQVMAGARRPAGHGRRLRHRRLLRRPWHRRAAGRPRATRPSRHDQGPRLPRL